MFKLTLPLPQKILLADWLELFALVAADKSSSSGDLERALRRAAIITPDDPMVVEEKCVEVFLELERRATAAQIRTSPLARIHAGGRGRTGRIEDPMELATRSSNAGSTS